MNKLLRGIVLSAAAGVVLMVLLSILGLISNNNGNSFGFYYKTEFASVVLILALVYIVVSDGWLSWIGESGLVLLVLFILWTGAKTEFICLLILTVFILWRHLRREGKVPYQDANSYGLLRFVFKVIYFPIVVLNAVTDKTGLVRFKRIGLYLIRFCYPIMFVFSVVLIGLFRLAKDSWYKFPIPDTFFDRMMLGLIGFEEYPISLFGNSIPNVAGDDLTHNYFYFCLDNGYVRLLLEFGVIAMVSFIAVMTVVQSYLDRKRYYVSCFVVFVFSLEFYMNFVVIPNLLLLILFILANCLSSDKPSPGGCEKLSFRRVSVKRRWIMACMTFVLAAILFLWCFTAYSLTLHDDYEPKYNATLVVPRNLLDADTDLLGLAESFLLDHNDAYCIVDSEADKNTLVSSGIDPSRIVLANYDSIDDMLIVSHDIIETNDLPPRMTVLAYNMQQECISRRSNDLHIPVNSISMKPSERYLVYLFREQWRLLCER